MQITLPQGYDWYGPITLTAKSAVQVQSRYGCYIATQEPQSETDGMIATTLQPAVFQAGQTLRLRPMRDIGTIIVWIGEIV